MKLIYPPTLSSALKNKHLLLDTTVFRDALTKPTVFNEFFHTLKESEVVLTTIDLVKYELLKGTSNTVKYSEREKFINGIIDVTIPVLPKTFELVYDLIQIYGLDGVQLSITDLLLGATLMQYKKNIFLMTRDTTDFLQNVFELSFIVNASHTRGIFTYGIYQCSK